MTKFSLNLTLVFFFALFFYAPLQASPQLLRTPAASERPGASSATQSTPSSAQAHVQNKITAYTLPPDLYRKARNRGRIGFATRIIGFFYGLFVLWFILRRRLSAKYRDWAEFVSRRRIVQALVFIPLLVLTIGVLQLPVDMFEESVLKLYKISVQPWPSWAADWAKAQFLAILFGSFLAWILYAVIRKSPRRWWLYFWIISLPILLFVIFISPYVIDPLFNKYEPLSTKAPQLVPELQRVTRRAGQEVSPERMFWMKASDKTIATNASVNGFGASKRIIIWDTTIAQETTDEILTDFGHEMGHYVLGHVWKGFLFFSALIFVLFYLGYRSIGWLLARSGPAWGIRSLEDWASLPALLLLLTLFGFASNAIGNAFSRYQEHQADIYSLEVTHDIVPDAGQAFARSFQIYGETVLVDPDPNPVNVFLFFDHPPVADRIHLGVTYDPWSKGESPQFVK
ncbi:MAG TPA: M48 family metallopeptidase [Candidatus Angelobacter sp.]|nr:M48 family metallopeptidase [Candidatus Angelobacter sp.]